MLSGPCTWHSNRADSESYNGMCSNHTVDAMTRPTLFTHICTTAPWPHSSQVRPRRKVVAVDAVATGSRKRGRVCSCRWPRGQRRYGRGTASSAIRRLQLLHPKRARATSCDFQAYVTAKWMLAISGRRPGRNIALAAAPLRSRGVAAATVGMHGRNPWLQRSSSAELASANAVEI